MAEIKEKKTASNNVIYFQIFAIMVVLISIISLYKESLRYQEKNHPATQWININTGKKNLLKTTPELTKLLQNDKPNLIISYYDEDLSWLNMLEHLSNKIYIYHKKAPYAWPKNLDKKLKHKISIHKMKNIGRDPHSYLYHIIHNYNHLGKRNVFTIASAQWVSRFSTLIYRLLDKPYCWKKYPKEKIKNYSFPGIGFLNMIPHMNKPYTTFEKSEFDSFGQWSEHYLNIPKENLQEYEICEWDGIFSATDKEIQKYPKELYQKIIKSVENSENPENGYYVTFTWQILFPQKNFSKNNTTTVN